MVAETVKRHPLIYWAQRDNVLFLTVEVEDMKIEKLVCEGNKFHISGTSSKNEAYEADLELYGSINGSERRQIATSRHVELVIPKENADWWPRLLKNSQKVPWLKVDFNKWVDEDEVNEESNQFDFSNMNFPGADFSGLGGLGGEDDAPESDTEEEDNADLPPLDDVEPEKPTSTSTA